MLLWRRSDRLLPMLLVFLAGAANAALPSPAPPAEKQPLAGKHVDIELQSGKMLRGVVIEDAAAGKIPGTIARLRVADPRNGSRPMLGAAAIKQVTAADGARLLVFDETTKCLAPPDAEKLAAIHRAAEAAKPPAASPKPAQTRPAHPAKKGGDESAASGGDEAARRKANEEKRQEFFKKTGVWLWPDLTAEEQQEALAKGKDYVRKVSEKFAALNMHLYETRYFLFLSDLPPPAAGLYTSCLDEMHAQLCKAFAIKDRDRVWLGGKVPVIAFARGESFAAFEEEFFKSRVDPRSAQGLAHQQSSGEVVVSCHCGNDPYYFAAVLVHETTHGFVHRYKSGQIIPNWLNEGIAEWVAMNVVVKDQGVKRKVKDALLRMRQTGSLGGDFFTADHIASGQYGIATAMVDYLLRSNPKGFRAMFDNIKSGDSWQSALKKSYRMTPEQLTQQFGMSIGIPNLQP